MKRIHIKNMVCDRCKYILERDFKDADIKVDSIELGEIRIQEPDAKTIGKIKGIIEKNGFEIIHVETELLVERIKSLLIKGLTSKNFDGKNISDFLSQSLNKEYSHISKLFSRIEGHTIEKHLIHLRIEKTKELIQMKNTSFSEIAYSLHYSNSSHLAKQFKSVTGLSMGEYKKLQNWNRKSIDQII